MNPSDNPSAQDWFNSIPSPNPPVSPEPFQKPPSKKRWVIFAAVGIVLLVTAIGIGTYSLLSTKKCLSSTDYKVFYNSQPADQSALKHNFYTTSLQFKNGTTTYVDPNSAQNELKRIIDFYNSRSSSASIIITIVSDYTSNDTEQTASKRIDVLKSALLKGGIPEQQLSIEQPAFIDTSDELSEDSPLLASSTSYLTISSDKNCRQ